MMLDAQLTNFCTYGKVMLGKRLKTYAKATLELLRLKVHSSSLRTFLKICTIKPPVTPQSFPAPANFFSSNVFCATLMLCKSVLSIIVVYVSPKSTISGDVYTLRSFSGSMEGVKQSRNP